MKRVLKCQKCGEIYATKESTGPGLGIPSPMEIGTQMCRVCHSNSVKWMGEREAVRPGIAPLAMFVFAILVVIGVLSVYWVYNG